MRKRLMIHKGERLMIHKGKRLMIHKGRPQAPHVQKVASAPCSEGHKRLMIHEGRKGLMIHKGKRPQRLQAPHDPQRSSLGACDPATMVNCPMPDTYLCPVCSVDFVCVHCLAHSLVVEVWTLGRIWRPGLTIMTMKATRETSHTTASEMRSPLIQVKSKQLFTNLVWPLMSIPTQIPTLHIKHDVWTTTANCCLS